LPEVELPVRTVATQLEDVWTEVPLELVDKVVLVVVREELADSGVGTTEEVEVEGVAALVGEDET
jgi:hypothetical protein